MHSRTTAQEILQTSPASDSTTGSPDSAPAARSKASARVLRQGAPRDKDHRLRTRRRCRCSRAASSRSATPTARRRRPPGWKPHPMQGWSPDFIAKLTGDAVASKAISQVLRIAKPDASSAARTSPRRKASSSASPPAERSPARCNCRRGAEGLHDPVHAARHRRALPQHASVRRCVRRHDRRGVGDRTFNARLHPGAAKAMIPSDDHRRTTFARDQPLLRVKRHSSM